MKEVSASTWTEAVGWVWHPHCQLHSRLLYVAVAPAFVPARLESRAGGRRGTVRGLAYCAACPDPAACRPTGHPIAREPTDTTHARRVRHRGRAVPGSRDSVRLERVAGLGHAPLWAGGPGVGVCHLGARCRAPT